MTIFTICALSSSQGMKEQLATLQGFLGLSSLSERAENKANGAGSSSGEEIVAAARFSHLGYQFLAPRVSVCH